MNRLTILKTTALIIVMILSVAGVSTVQAADPVDTSAIAGTWYGNMHFSVDPHVERIRVVIPAGCEAGDVCGTLFNYRVQCEWELTFTGYSNGAYNYYFSDTLKGGCPAGSAGTLTLLPDGTLYRVHTTPMFTASGVLDQRPFGP